MWQETSFRSATPSTGMKTSTPSALRCAAFVAAVSLCTALSAQSDTSSTSTSSSATDRGADMSAHTKLKHSDRAFFEKAAKSGMKEVEISQASIDRLMNPELKSFAQTMVTDHSKTNSELMALAARKGVTLPSKEMKWEEKWSKKTKDVDDDYIKTMVDDHEDDVKLFEKAAKSDDPEIAAFAQKTLPTLQHHLTMARDLKKAVK
jgi:putative membrane protein